MTDEIIIEGSQGEKPPRTWDFFLTIFLLFILLVMTAIFIFSGFGAGVTTITCADSAESCNYAVLSAGSLLMIVGSSVVALAGLITTIVVIARRKLSSLVALIFCLASVGVFLLGSWLVDLAVPGA